MRVRGTRVQTSSRRLTSSGVILQIGVCRAGLRGRPRTHPHPGERRKWHGIGVSVAGKGGETPENLPQRAHAAVIYNPVKVDLVKLRRVVDERERKHAWGPSQWIETTAADPGESMARQAVADGARLVIACGGDGTVRSVAAGMRGAGVPMGIVPLGTGNLLARNLEIPIDSLDAAVAVAMSGSIRPIDLGTVDYTAAGGEERSEVFLVMAGIGMDADMIEGTDDDLKSQVGWVAYVSTFVRSVFTGHRIRADYSLDDGELTHAHARSLLVGNCGVLQGGMVLMPGALVSDGKLDMVALRPKGILGWLRLAYAVLVQNTLFERLGVPPARKWSEQFNARMRARREHWAEWAGIELPTPTDKSEARTRRRRERRADAQTLIHEQARSISVEVLEKPARFQIDGDGIGDVTAFVARVRPHSLSIRVPF